MIHGQAFRSIASQPPIWEGMPYRAPEDMLDSYVG